MRQTRHRTLLPKHKRKKKKQKSKGSIIGVALVCLFVFLTLMSFFNRPTKYGTIIIDEDVTVVGSMSEGIVTTEFGAKKGQYLRVTISDLKLISNDPLVIALQGGGSDWMKQLSHNFTFPIPIPKNSVYKVRLSPNSVFGGKILCHVLIKLI